jgi:hypothetical protein
MLGLSHSGFHLALIETSLHRCHLSMDAATLCDSVAGSLRWLETGQGSDQLPATQQVCRHASTVSAEEARALLHELRSRRAIVPLPPSLPPPPLAATGLSLHGAHSILPPFKSSVRRDPALFQGF